MSDRYVLGSPDETIPISIIPQPRGEYGGHRGQSDSVTRPDLPTVPGPAPVRADRERRRAGHGHSSGYGPGDGDGIGSGSGSGSNGSEPDPRRRPSEERRGAKRGLGATVLPPVLVTLGLGAYHLGASQVRQDESATWWAAHLSWGDLGKLLDNTDVVLAPYYVLMHVWVSLAGSSPAMLRLPSLLATAATAGLLALLGRRMFDAPTGLVAGLVFAVLPVTTLYAQEARPFALSALAVVAAALLLYRALDHEGADRWGGYAFGMLCTGLFHPVAATVVVAYLVMTMTTQRERIGAWFAVTLVPVAPLLAVLMLARGQNHQDPAGASGLDSLLHLPQDLLGSSRVAAAVGLLVVLGVLLSRKTGLALLVWAVLPPVALFVLRSYGNLFTPSYFVFTVPALALLAAAGVCRLGRALPGKVPGVASRQIVIGLAGAAAVAAVSFQALQPVHADPQPGQRDFQAAAGYLLTQSKAGDGVVYGGDQVNVTRAFGYQLRDMSIRPREVFVSVPPQQDGTYTGKPCSAPVVCTKGVNRIWVVSTANAAAPYAGMTSVEAKFLQANYKATSAQEFAGALRVTLLQRTRAKAAGH